ncbi:metalloregulator ArsR/SmtB family transcription factor [Bdellovibrionota bacterium FG-2]
MRSEVQVFKALSDETRLKMVALLLRRGELCVCDFVEGMRISQSKASRHLRYLQRAGLLEDRREAVWVYYRVNRKPSLFQKAVLKTIEALFSSAPIKEAQVQLEKWLKGKRCG